MSTVLLLPQLKQASICLSLFFSASLILVNTLIYLAAATPYEFLITGNFNLHLDHPDDLQVKQFLAALDSTNLFLRDHHILDLGITPTSSSLNPVMDYSPISPSDHLPILSTLSILPSIPPPSTQSSFRCFKSISVFKFTRDILYFRLFTHPPVWFCWCLPSTQPLSHRISTVLWVSCR